MLPIFALAETQSWRRDDYSVSLRCHVDELCAHTGLAIEAPTGSSRIMHVDPATTLGLFERLSAWSPHTLAWLSAAIRGVR